MYICMTSEDVMLIKAILGGVGNEPTEEKFRKAYNVINSIKKDDNPIVARFWLKRL
jgi:predicted nucleic acid-binding protein